MSNTLRCSILIGIVLYYIVIIQFLKRKSLSLKYSLLWIVLGIVMGIIAVFPQILGEVVRIMGIQSQVNGVYAIFIFFIIMILMTLTSIVSKQTERIKRLTQYVAVLEKKVRENEEKLLERGKNDEEDRYHNISSEQ